MTITQKERVIAQINHIETDIVPYHLMFDPGSNIEERLDAFYGGDSWRGAIDNAIYQLPLPSLGINLDLGVESFTDEYGSVWRTDLRPFSLLKPSSQA